VKKSTRAQGDEVEDRVLEILKPFFRKTAGSGSVWKDGDLRAPGWLVEVKKRSTTGASCTGSDLHKLINRANLEGKNWTFICQNFDRELVTMIDINVFAFLFEEALIGEELRNSNPELYEDLYNKIIKHA
jgi:hypothetical protein